MKKEGHLTHVPQKREERKLIVVHHKGGSQDGLSAKIIRKQKGVAENDL